MNWILRSVIAMAWGFAATCMAQNSDSILIERMLNQAPQDAGTLYFARQFVGRPYVAHTLEINNEEQLVVNTRQLDCTTLVETVVALWLTHHDRQHSFAAYCRHLQQLRYRDGIIAGYTSRLHYFTDWIVCNSERGIVHEIQLSEAPFNGVQTIKVNYMSTHPDAYKALAQNPQLVSVIAQQERQMNGLEFRFIPKAQVLNNRTLRSVIRDGDIIAITTSKPGLDIAHLGFAVWQTDGLHLLNASQLHKKVVVEPMTLRRYLYKHPTFTGIRIIRVRNNTGHGGA